MTLTPTRLRLLTRSCWTLSLLVVAVPFVFPFLWMVSSAFKGATEIFGQPTLIPAVWHWRNFINENDDAETADVWFQLAVFGEVVYG